MKAEEKSLSAAVVRLGALVAAVAAFLAIAAAPASAIEYIHTISFHGTGANELKTPTSLDIDNSAGASKNDVYVTDSGNGNVEKFDPSGTFILKFGEGELSNPTFIAVDSSSSASSGDVYVADLNSMKIRKYTESGALVTGWGSSGVLDGSGCGGIEYIGGIDVDSTGHLDVWDVNGSKVCKFAQDGTFVAKTSEGTCRGHSPTGFGVAPDDQTFYKVDGSPALQRFTETAGQCVQVSKEEGVTGLTVAPGGTVYAAYGTTVSEFQFNPAGQPLDGEGNACTTTLVESGGGCAATFIFGAEVLTGAGGLGVSLDKTVFVADTAGHEVDVFKEAITPIAETFEPTGNDGVSGQADPNGVGPITECFFEFGETKAYGEQEECDQSVPFNATEEVSATLPLENEKTYHYRLVVGNGEPGIVGRGKDRMISPHNVKGVQTTPATEVTQESAILNGEFEGTDEDTHYFFEYGQSVAYGHQTAIAPGDDAGATTGPTQISTEITGLEPGVTYHFRVVTQNPLGTTKGLDSSFKAYELPSIDSATTSKLTASSAEVDATINPHEFETTYYVEYGPTPSYGSVAPIPAGTLAPGNSPQTVEIPLTGLEGILYHFRVVAESKWGTVRTEDQSFNFFPQTCPNSTVRQQNESQYLPDCRAFELVSPEETGNILLSPSAATIGPEAVSPPRFAYVGVFGGIRGSEPTNGLSADTYVATRTNVGWKSHQVGIRGSEGLATGGLFPNTDFSRFLDFRENPGIFEGQHQPPHNIPYIWDSEGNSLGRWPTNFGSIENAETNPNALQPSPDLTHLAIASTHTEFAPGGLTKGIGSAYDFNAETGVTSIISRIGSGDIELEPTNTETEPQIGIYFPGGTFEYLNEYVRPEYAHPPVSTDGSHILMATLSKAIGTTYSPQKPPGKLYMRVNDAVTYEVSQGHDVNYAGMTPDGTKVFFTTAEQLTAEDTDSSVDIYMWSEATDELTLISNAQPGAESNGNGDACATSWDIECGAWPVKGQPFLDDTGIAAQTGEIYFYSPEQLDGSKGTPNAENLYVYRGGASQFVASLKPTGSAESTEHGEGPVSRINVSPTGSHAAIITSSRLTSYDNSGFREMYAYDPVTRAIACASCRPDGKAPEANVEGAIAGLFMSDDGRTFFTTDDALIPTDTNEGQDVYEYAEGRPQLITTGTGVSRGMGFSEEGLAGVSADGINVYFSTRNVLVPQNHNGPFMALYDARVNGGFPFEPSLAPCEAADECHGAGNAAPETPVVTSEGDLGDRGNAPNPKTHKKHKEKKHKKHRAKRHHRHGKGGK